MTLLNGVAMFAATAVIVPILIHLRKRRKSKVVDWPAMQFLKRTVTSRRRGVTLENLLLLLLRCLLVLLFVLAMARPAIESSRYFSWLMFFLLAGSGLLLLTASLVSNWQPRNRFIGILIATILLGVSGATLSVGPESLVDSEMDRDIALVIDSSLTMSLGDDETSHFDKAIAQARSLVGKLAGNSTVSIVLAGPITETVAGSPFRNLRRAEQVLGTLAPVAGSSDLESAIQQAKSLLERAPNSSKQILLLTDDQLCTWEIGKFSDLEVACAAIVAHVPKQTTNISVDRLEIKSSLVTVSQPVPIEVEIRNGGSTTVQDVVVKLMVDGREASTDALIQIEPGVSSTVRFLHAFAKSGQHIVSGTIEVADQLPEDNRIESVIDVIPNLSILIVNGSTDADPAQQSATFTQLALDPTSLRKPPVGDGIVKSIRPIIATAISATRLNEIESLENFHLVMLCDVPRLPIDAAERLGRFVEDGGGLWIIPSEQADSSFYNNWRVPLTDEPIMPAQLVERIQWLGKVEPDGRVPRLGVALDVAGRPFISDLFERGGHDLADVSLFQFWNMTPSEQAIVGMRLTNGAVLFAEQAIGRGRVLLQSISFVRRDSTFPATLGFPVLMHLWTHHLASSQAATFNVDPNSDLMTDLTARLDSTDRIETLQLSEPDGTKREIPVQWKEDSSFARVGRVAVPGVYQLNNDDTGTAVSSFAVHRDKEESDLSAVSEDRLNEISQELGIEFIDDVSQLTSSVASESVGAEIWDILLFTVLCLLAGECLLTKWIRSRRRLTPIASSGSSDLSEPTNRSEITSQHSYPSLGLSLAISTARSMGEKQKAEVTSERFLSSGFRPIASTLETSRLWENVPVTESVRASVGAP